jgi:hypothetical protein
MSFGRKGFAGPRSQCAGIVMADKLGAEDDLKLA